MPAELDVQQLFIDLLARRCIDDDDRLPIAPARDKCTSRHQLEGFLSTQRHRNAPSPRHHRRPVLSARAPLAPHLARRVALLAERVDVKEDLPILARERREVEIRLGASSPERLRERRGVRLPVVVIVGEGEGRDEWVRGVAFQRLLQRGRMLKLGQVRIRQLAVGEPKCLGRAGRKSGGG